MRLHTHDKCTFTFNFTSLLQSCNTQKTKKNKKTKNKKQKTKKESKLFFLFELNKIFIT